MTNISKTAAAGIIFFSIVLAGFVGIKVDQTTVALLGGAFIGLVVAIPTTALILIMGLKPRNTEQGQVHMPPQTPAQTHTHYHTHNNNTMTIYVSRRGLSPFDQCTEVARTLQVSRHMAERLMQAGDVKLIEPPQGIN